jgi:hypothetical protein
MRWPPAHDHGSVHVDMCSPVDPRSLSQPAADREVAHTCRVISQASADPRFAQLMASNRVVWELGRDYGQGSHPAGIDRPTGAPGVGGWHGADVGAVTDTASRPGSQR